MFTFIDNFSMKKGDKIMINTDLSKNMIKFFNDTTKQYHSTTIPVDTDNKHAF